MSDDDDYMSMSFDQPEEKPLSSLQRRQQQKREAEIRGRPKSKAELAAEEKAAREAALSTSLLEEAAAKKNKGLAMMARMGFKAGSTLGAKGNTDARREPIGISMKEDRGGIGMENEKRRRLREAFGDGDDDAAAKKRKVEEPGEYRDRMARERERERQERMVYSAQKVAEGMQEEADQSTPPGPDESTTGRDETKPTEKNGTKKQKKNSSRPLKSINVLWRTLARQREEKERDHRMRYDLEQSLSRLPTYDDEDEDEDDKRALGKKKTLYVAAEDLDEEDPELDEFDELEPDEKLRRLVTFMRDEWNYCFWCKFKYPDETMDGCPGLTEEDHD